MANIQLKSFTVKASPVPADIIYAADSANSFDEVQITISALIGAYPGLLSIGSGLTTITSAAGTTTLTVTSTYYQLVVGSTTQNIVLPVVSTLANGQSFYIINSSSGAVTVKSSGGNTIQVMGANTAMLVTFNNTAGTGSASWSPTLYSSSGLVIPVTVAQGGTGVTSVTISPTASAWAGWDANKNMSANNFLDGYTTIATAAGTTTLTVGSTYYQFFTGSTTQTVLLPVTSTLVLGQSFFVVNNSSGVVTVQSSGGNTIQAMAANTQAEFTCILTSGTSAASWQIFNYSANTITFPLAIALGGTGVASVTTAPAATAWAGWDANKNLTANNLIESYTTTATAAGTTTLTVGSTFQQFFTGSTTQTVVLPVTSTLVLGQSFLVVNNSSGVVTVQSSGSNTITALSGGTQAVFTCILTSGTTAASWNSDYSSKNFTAPTVQKFTSGSGTYTTPTNPSPLYINVMMVGGGGGGGGSGTAAGTPSGNGGNTTFGTTLLVANGGVGGTFDSTGGVGGTASLGSGPIGTALQGGYGGGAGAGILANTAVPPGGDGGVSALGGAGAGGGLSQAGSAAVTNSGSGGGGGGTANINNQGAGAGGGAGGYVNAIIVSPSATYSYAVGIAGTAGGAGASGFAGAAGGSGYIVVTEYYQ